MASDGLWDVMSRSKAVKMVRHKASEAAAEALLEAVVSQTRFNDDASIIVIDVLPSLDLPTFPEVAEKVSSSQQIKKKPSGGGGGGGGLFACFKSAEVQELDSRDVSGLGALHLFSDVDCLVAYPNIRTELLGDENGGRTSQPRSSAETLVRDLTLHGSVYGGMSEPVDDGGAVAEGFHHLKSDELLPRVCVCSPVQEKPPSLLLLATP